MSGQITLDNSGPPLWQPAAPIAVCRLDSAQTDQSKRFALIPNVVCEQIERGIGPNSSTAHLRYVLDTSGLYPDWPSDFGDIWPQDAQSGPYIVATDDRIVVITFTAEGEVKMLFDGFAQIPQVNLDPSSQRVTFTATGAECRSWDQPISGRIQRDADDPDAGADFWTNLPPRFNPSDGRGGVLPNCTPDGHDVNQADPKTSYPVFIDEHIERSPDPRTLWTVSKAIRYILATANKAQKYVDNPPLSDCTTLLLVKVPVAGSGDGTVDPTDPSTYTTKDMPLRDYDCSNKAWPDVLQELLGMVGFGFYFSEPEDYGDDGPTLTLIFFRLDQSDTTPVNLMLDEYGAKLDPSANDIGSLALARDINQVVNAWAVETVPKRWEISVVLAPAFQPAAGDETAANRTQFLKSRIADATATIARKYRWYVADEAGDGHWTGASWSTLLPCDFSPLWPDDSDGNPSYVHRLRPGSRHLITLDQSNHPRQAMLQYSQDYTGYFPKLWDGTGTWTEITGGWKLLENRLGIECTSEDVEQWMVGKGKPDLKGITWQANPPTGKQFYLMLTTVIDDDLMLSTSVMNRIASPTKFARWRLIDARDHYQKNTVHYPSWFNSDALSGGTKADVVARDDTQNAINLARQYRAAHEMPPLAGSVTIPYLTAYYGLGDLIDSIAGREISLHTNAATDKGEGPRYPFVTRIAWSFSSDRQSTTLQLTDLRAAPSLHE